jgi:hypothetical protein
MDEHMPLFSRARALALSEHIPSTSEAEQLSSPAQRDSGHALARALREALSALEHRRFETDEIAARSLRPKIRRANAHDVEL